MYEFSRHSIEQIGRRNISQELVLWIVTNATKIYKEEEVTIYESLINENEKVYLCRVFVNENKLPPLIITAYKTSKLNKYENKIRQTN
jgi:hypothetical protein